MVHFLNSDFKSFKETIDDRFYVDKSEIIAYLNELIDTPFKYICSKRTKGFGKTVTADMLVIILYFNMDIPGISTAD
ncbi:MAG: hypothetical protein ACI4WM_07765 [Erysipelotrichaceae bacterium]